MATRAPLVSVVMPTYGHAAFVARAVESLLAQDVADWQLVIVDDGSPDDTGGALRPYLADPRVEYHRLDENRGLGAALNVALERAHAPLIAYLPSDDVFFAGHLASLADALAADLEAVLAYSGVRREHRVPGKGVLWRGTALGAVEGFPLQLVQVMHRRTDDRWVERDTLTTDDLDRMFWRKLRARGTFVGTQKITSEWVDHPLQRHKVIREPLGGVNPYRIRYGVRRPLRFHSTTGNPIDEVEHYRRFRERADTPPAPDALKILLVGELAFNPERVLALEERGHRLSGLWTEAGHWFNAVGPLPFGHVEDLPRDGWRDAVRALNPDIIYALLNWEAVPFAHEVLDAELGVPFVWHFKESPFDCIANGTWDLLADLQTRSDGQIYPSPEAREWFAAAVPASADGPSLVLDGDLPKRDWFTDERSPLLSATDGEVHTVVPGGPIGFDPALAGELASLGVHIHFYGTFHQAVFQPWIDEVGRVAADRFHLHPQVDQSGWVSEFSRYDAGWLHLVRSENGGDIRRALWPDLNYPARIPTLSAAGVPFIQLDNSESIVATQSLARELDIGLFMRTPQQLADELRDAARMPELRENAWRERHRFSFDYHADRLLKFFRDVMAARRGGRQTVAVRARRERVAPA